MNVFNSVKGLHPRRNAFSAHTYRNDFTSSLGVNIPVFIQHVVPGTRIKVSASALVRLQALIAPIMDNIDYYVHFWKIPYRLLEDDRFTQFISQEIDAADYDALFARPDDLCAKVYDVIKDSNLTTEKKVQCYNHIFGDGGLLDFLGYDKGLFDEVDSDFARTDSGNQTISVNFRNCIAYYMLHVNWYMNENVPYFDDFVDLVDSLVKHQDLQFLAELLVKTWITFGTSFLPHGWEKDYFTSALPNVQFGEPVSLPLAGSAPVISTGSYQASVLAAPNSLLGTNNDYAVVSLPKATVNYDYDPDTGQYGLEVPSYNNNPASKVPAVSINSDFAEEMELQADLSEASAITINELRFANALQLFKERQMRFGRRRLEHYKGFFDVSPEDLRLQVPKYLGGGRIPINISDIEQTSQSATTPQGNLAGKATAVAGGFAGFSTFCSEETIIIGIAFAMPHITYSQSVSKFILKTNDIYDYFNPSFEHLGEQPILKGELFAGAMENFKDEFGYTPRYNEYRFHNNEMHGAFKNSLAFWTLGRIFDGTPSLNAYFVYMQPKVFNRIFAVENSDPMLVSMLFRQRIIQPVSKYGTPMLLA